MMQTRSHARRVAQLGGYRPAAPSLAAHSLAVPFVAFLIAVFLAPVAKATEVQRVVSDSGVTAWLVEDHANPVISMSFAVPGGAASDPEGKAGLANLASGLLDEGAGDLRSQDFQARLAEKAIKLSFDASSDHFYGSLRTLTEHRDAAANLLSLALTKPRFDKTAVERIRSQVLANIASRSARPSARANRALDRLMFPDHPYGHRVSGTKNSVQAITRPDLRNFAETRLARERLMIGVAGDITPDELKAWLDAAFGALPAEGGALPAVRETTAVAKGDRVVIEQDVPQAWVAFGHGGVARDDPDYYAATLVDYILGGGSFASRLFEEVREKRGLVYSVYTYLNPMDRASVYGGGLGTSNAQVAKAVEVVRNEWRRLAENGPTAEELADAKTHLKGAFPLRLSSTKQIAEILVAMQRENLGIDYIDERKALIDAITLADAKRVAAEMLAPDDLTFVVVGNPTDFEPTREPPDLDAEG
jgi:zinc protease